MDDTASGDLLASLAVDYITNDKIKKGAQLKLVYPKEMLVIPSPAAIFKGTKNPAAAKNSLISYCLKMHNTLLRMKVRYQ